MSFNSNGFKEIGKDIFLCKNFISKENAQKLFDLAMSYSEDQWSDKVHHSIAEFHVKELHNYLKVLKERFLDDVVLDEYCYFQKYDIGQHMSDHQDDNKVLKDIEKSKDYKDGMEFNFVNQPVYGIVLYLNKSDGGELYYGEQDITYFPEPGDLVIHSAEKHCLHRSNPIQSGVKICSPTYAYKKIKVPV
jgi:hypothetical protein